MILQDGRLPNAAVTWTIFLSLIQSNYHFTHPPCAFRSSLSFPVYMCECLSMVACSFVCLSLSLHRLLYLAFFMFFSFCARLSYLCVSIAKGKPSLLRRHIRPSEALKHLYSALSWPLNGRSKGGLSNHVAFKLNSSGLRSLLYYNITNYDYANNNNL